MTSWSILQKKKKTPHPSPQKQNVIRAFLLLLFLLLLLPPHCLAMYRVVWYFSCDCISFGKNIQYIFSFYQYICTHNTFHSQHTHYMLRTHTQMSSGSSNNKTNVGISALSIEIFISSSCSPSPFLFYFKFSCIVVSFTHTRIFNQFLCWLCVHSKRREKKTKNKNEIATMATDYCYYGGE